MTAMPPAKEELMERHVRPWLVFGLILLGVVSRIVPHPWNATPVMAIALFGGT